MNVYGISSMQRGCLFGWRSSDSIQKKNVCVLHEITYLTAAASAVDNQRLRDNAECNLLSRREAWREKSVRITLTAQ